MNSPILTRIFWVRGLRAFGDGYVSLLLPVYLIELGMNPFEVGAITTATLIGSGILTLLAGLQAYRFTYKTLLLAATGLMAATGFSFAAITEFWPLLLVAFVGTLNPSSGDVSLFLPLEHAVLSRFVGDRQRTAVFVRYSMIGALVAAAGALAAGLPDFAAASIQIDARDALQAMFVLYGIIGLLCAAIYATLPEETGSTETGSVNKTRALRHRKRLPKQFCCSAWMHSAAASWCRLCWRYGCSRSFSFPFLRPALFFSGPEYSPRSPILRRFGLPTGLD